MEYIEPNYYELIKGSKNYPIRFVKNLQKKYRVYVLLDNPSGSQFDPKQMLGGDLSRLDLTFSNTANLKSNSSIKFMMDPVQIELEDRMTKILKDSGIQILKQSHIICPDKVCSSQDSAGRQPVSPPLPLPGQAENKARMAEPDTAEILRFILREKDREGMGPQAQQAAPVRQSAPVYRQPAQMNQVAYRPNPAPAYSPPAYIPPVAAARQAATSVASGAKSAVRGSAAQRLIKR
jgi:hypothetical protein